MSANTKTPVLIVTGPPGVGKTTVAGMLAARSDRAVHLESDAFFHFIRSGYIEPWKAESGAQNRTVMGIVAQVAAAYAEAGFFTIVDGIIIPGWFFEPVRDALRQAGHPVAYAVLRAPLPVCLSRANSRATEPLEDPEVIEHLWRSFADLGALEPHAIDVATNGPEDATGLLAARLADGSLTA